MADPAVFKNNLYTYIHAAKAESNTPIRRLSKIVRALAPYGTLLCDDDIECREAAMSETVSQSVMVGRWVMVNADAAALWLTRTLAPGS